MSFILDDYNAQRPSHRGSLMPVTITCRSLRSGGGAFVTVLAQAPQAATRLWLQNRRVLGVRSAIACRIVVRYDTV